MKHSAVSTLHNFTPGRFFRVNITLPFKQHADPKGSNLIVVVRGLGPSVGRSERQGLTRDIPEHRPRPAIRAVRPRLSGQVRLLYLFQPVLYTILSFLKTAMPPHGSTLTVTNALTCGPQHDRTVEKIARCREGIGASQPHQTCRPTFFE